MTALVTEGYSLTAKQLARLAKTDESLARLRAMRQERVVAADGPGLATWAFDSYLQLGLHRIVSLGDGIVAEWNARRVVNCAILSRSLIETVSAWWHLLDRTVGLLQEEDIRGAHALATKALFAVRYKREGDPAFPKATNAMTFVQKIDKTFPGVLHFYESICEVVHPNSDAVLLFGHVDQEKVELVLDGQQAAKEDYAIKKVVFGFLMFDIAEKCFAAYREKIRGQLGSLERKFGRYPSCWPGEPDPELSGV